MRGGAYSSVACLRLLRVWGGGDRGAREGGGGGDWERCGWRSAGPFTVELS